MKAAAPLSIPEQMKVLQSREDIATWSLAHLGLPAEWRDTNQEGNIERCQEAVNRIFTLTRADIEASLSAQTLEDGVRVQKIKNGLQDCAQAISRAATQSSSPNSRRRWR